MNGDIKIENSKAFKLPCISNDWTESLKFLVVLVVKSTTESLMPWRIRVLVVGESLLLIFLLGLTDHDWNVR